ncbi:O-antigen ligase family protein, partial [Enterococcus sp. CSURQ0835]|uniref:O-antigen ligase family protein n=1 Tax=Enterococcus sp. CSURQ0835 TaxID=2681394 RepID=UPI001356A686
MDKKYILGKILAITVLLDAINGFFTMYIGSFSEQIIPLFRMILIVYMLIIIANLKKYLFLKLTVIITFLLVMTSCVTVLGNSYTSSDYLTNIIYTSKIIYFFVLTVLLWNFNTSQISNYTWYISIIRTNSYLLPMLIFVPTILGMSRRTYEGSNLGSSGFFIANNSTNIVLIILTSFLFFEIFINCTCNRFDKYFYFLSLYTLFLQGSKTSYFCLILFLIGNV